VGRFDPTPISMQLQKSFKHEVFNAASIGLFIAEEGYLPI